jgi:hypothetical protein
LIKPPSIARIQQKLETLPKLSEFMNIRVGVQTGNNKVFIVSKSHIPKGEEAIFIPYLSDREMEVYTTPQKVSQYLFYPYFEEKLLEEDEIRNKYPKTWKYLLLHQEMLESRYAVKKENKSWWQLDSPRCDYLLRPKIISPHLSIIRSPIIYPKDRQLESDLLRYFVAILNSSICYRYISEHSHKYGSGYSMLEPKTLLKTPVPDPTKVSSFDMSQLLRLVDQRFLASGKEAIQLEIEIDKAVSKLYGFTEEDCSIYGV